MRAYNGLMRRAFVLTAVTAIGGLLCYQAYRSRGAVQGEISDQDAHRFVQALHRMPPGDSTCAALGDYFRGATRGLRAYDTKLSMGRRQLCTAIRRSPERYAAIEAKL